MKEVEVALAAEQQKKQEFAQRIEFYGNAYQKLQGKLAGESLGNVFIVSQLSHNDVAVLVSSLCIFLFPGDLHDCGSCWGCQVLRRKCHI